MNSRWKLVLIALVVAAASAFSPVFAKQLVNMEFKQAPLVDVFQILGQLGGYNVLVDPSVSEEVSFALKNLTVEEALDLVTRTSGYRYKLMGNTLVIASDQRLKDEFGTKDYSFVVIEHVDVDAAKSLVQLVVPELNSYVDREASLLVMFGLTNELELARRVLEQYDQEAFAVVESDIPGMAKKDVIGLSTSRVPVYYADGERILSIVRQRWPYREFEWEELTQNLVGLTSAEEWQEIKAFVEDNDLPDFILKGLLGDEEDMIALVEYRGIVNPVRLGDELYDWEIVSIDDGVVEFEKGPRTLSIRMGR